jgi:hypothetical protein
MLSGQVLDGLLGLFAVLLMACSWMTHVVVCATEGLWSLLAFGVVVFPVAVAHGVAIWVAAGL